VTRLALGRLTVDIDESSRPRRATLVGRLDETAPLASLAQALSGDVVLDTAGVTFINSIGLREWIRLLRNLSDRGVVVALDRVSEPLAAQLSMVLAARHRVTIVSLHVPYECTRCRFEESMLVEVAPHRAALSQMKAPQLPCPECGGDMELADLPERYFWFLREDAGP